MIGVLGQQEKERDSAIGVVLVFGLGLGVLLLSQYRGFASAATSILFGQVFGIGNRELLLLLVVAAGVLLSMTVLYRPLLFASVDPDVAAAKGVPTRLVGFAFLVVLALTVTEAAQIVGTLLVLSLTITPAAAAQRLSARPAMPSGWWRVCGPNATRDLPMASFTSSRSTPEPRGGGSVASSSRRPCATCAIRVAGGRCCTWTPTTPLPGRCTAGRVTRRARSTAAWLSILPRLSYCQPLCRWLGCRARPERCRAATLRRCPARRPGRGHR